jgi:hypothetical protein
MALGTALSAATEISSTAGVQYLTFTTAGKAAVQTVLDAGGKLTVCLMSSYLDYNNNAPVQDGDFTRIYLRYMEYSAGTSTHEPRLLVDDGGAIATIYAEESGNDDDALLRYVDSGDGSIAWSTVRGDETTSGTVRTDTSLHNYVAIYSIKNSGRGGAVVTDNARSYFVFDLSGISGATADTVQFSVYMDSYSSDTVHANIIAVQATALAGTTADYGNCFVADAAAVADNATFFGANF